MDILKGRILRIPDQQKGLKIPHMGWNSLHLQNNGRLFKGIPEADLMSILYIPIILQAEDPDTVKATTEYSTDDSCFRGEG